LSSVLADGAIYAAMLFMSYPEVTRVTGPLSGVFKALALIRQGSPVQALG
jgi:hypothetical protein